MEMVSLLSGFTVFLKKANNGTAISAVIVIGMVEWARTSGVHARGATYKP